jgi:hypothetical protein
LDPRIDFNEEKAVGVMIQQEFDGAGVRSGLRGQIAIAASHNALRTLGSSNGGRDFHHLLMAALNRAIAFPQVDQVAVFVAQQLDFDVAGLGDGVRRTHRGCRMPKGSRLRLLELGDKLRSSRTMRACRGGRRRPWPP